MQTFPSEHSKYKTRHFATHLQQMRVECVSSVKKKKDLASYRGCTLSQRQSKQKGTSESGAHLQSAKKNELNHKMINIASTPPPLKTPKPINMLMFFFLHIYRFRWTKMSHTSLRVNSQVSVHWRFEASTSLSLKSCILWCQKKKIMPLHTFRWAQRNFPTFSRKHQTICTHKYSFYLSQVVWLTNWL